MHLDPNRQGLTRLARFFDLQGLYRPKAKRFFLGLAVLFLLAGIALSLHGNPHALSNLDWRPLILLVLVAVPATIALSAYEFVLTGRLVGCQLAMPAAIEISIIGTAANFLPLPGATLVRVAALKAAGAGYGEGTKATLLVAGLWAGVAFFFAGAWMIRLGVGPIAVLFVVVGLVAWIVCFAYCLRQCAGPALPVTLSLVKVALVTTDALRMYLCLSALGLSVVFDQAAALAVAGVVGNAVSLVPAGFGVREAVSAGLAPLVGLAAGMAFLAAALNRLLGLITVVPLAIGLLLAGRGQGVHEGHGGVTNSSKHMVIIASAGRTGTRFFGDLLSSMIPGSYSVHEPDVLDGFSRYTWQRIKTFGIYHMVLGRMLGRTGIRNLSQQFLAGRLDRRQVVRRLRRQRSTYYKELSGEPIIESYYQWYGILPAVPDIFEHYRVVALVRDPRTWVASMMNFGSHFGSRDLVSRFGFRRLDPVMSGDADYAEHWDEMTPFDRLCWTWGAVNGRLLDFVRSNPHSRLYRFEDLFLSADRGRRLEDLLEFITTFSDRRFASLVDHDVLQERRHASTRRAFPDWPQWSPDQAVRLEEICGPLMRELGYGGEADWGAKLK